MENGVSRRSEKEEEEKILEDEELSIEGGEMSHRALRRSCWRMKDSVLEPRWSVER